MPITVVVEETATCPPSWLIVPQSCGLGHIRERAVAVVTIEAILSKVGTEDVLKTVVVVVSDADAGCLARHLETRFLRHVRKRAIPIVLV